MLCQHSGPITAVSHDFNVLTCHHVHAAKFFWYFFFVFLNLLFFTSWGIIAVALTPNIQVSAVLSSGVYTFWLIFGGFIVPRPQIHGWWIWSALLLLSSFLLALAPFVHNLPVPSCSVRLSFFCPSSASCCSYSASGHHLAQLLVAARGIYFISHCTVQSLFSLFFYM